MAEETPEERKARLQALRLAAELSTAPETETETEAGNGDGEPRNAADDRQESGAGTEAEPEPVIRFRNYVPRDESLQGLKVAPPQALTFEDPLAGAPVDTVEEPVINIAPKKANWDLRRDVAKKLEKLERRTQRAIIQLMQEEEKRRQAASLAAEAEDGVN